MPDHLVFSHANGFPAPVYRRLFDLWRPAFAVSAVTRFGHDPRFPVTRGWPRLVDELCAHVETLRLGDGRLWLAGHSLGGYLSLLAAHRLGARVSGVVLLDSPLIAGLSARLLKIGRCTGLDRHVMPLEQTRQRRTRWPDVDAVQAHFAAKPGFARWDAQVLRDYAEAGTVAHDGGRELLFDRDVECRIYANLPSRSVAETAARLSMPVAFVGGTRSREMRHTGLRATRRLVGDRLAWIDGGHLFPMEAPVATAERVRAMIARMAAPTATAAAA